MVKHLCPYTDTERVSGTPGRGVSVVEERGSSDGAELASKIVEGGTERSLTEGTQSSWTSISREEGLIRERETSEGTSGSDDLR